jgi:hypothetical protein
MSSPACNILVTCDRVSCSSVTLKASPFPEIDSLLGRQSAFFSKLVREIVMEQSGLLVDICGPAGHKGVPDVSALAIDRVMAVVLDT